MLVAKIPTQHTAYTLLITWRWLRADPDERRVRPDHWHAEPMTFEEFRAWFRACLDRKISNEPSRGRKDCRDWFMQAWRTAQEVNTPRLIVRWVPHEFRARLAHRIYTDD